MSTVIEFVCVVTHWFIFYSHPPPRAQEALKTGHFVSVLQVLMQLQRICNHPDLVTLRETGSSYVCSSLQYNTPSLVLGALQNDPWKVGRPHTHTHSWNMLLMSSKKNQINNTLI